MRVILVPVADRPECARALNTAFELGKKLNASVSGCHIRPHKGSDVTLSSEFAEAAWRGRRAHLHVRGGPHDAAVRDAGEDPSTLLR